MSQELSITNKESSKTSTDKNSSQFSEKLQSEVNNSSSLKQSENLEKNPMASSEKIDANIENIESGKKLEHSDEISDKNVQNSQTIQSDKNPENNSTFNDRNANNKFLSENQEKPKITIITIKSSQLIEDENDSEESPSISFKSKKNEKKISKSSNSNTVTDKMITDKSQLEVANSISDINKDSDKQIDTSIKRSYLIVSDMSIKNDTNEHEKMSDIADSDTEINCDSELRIKNEQAVANAKKLKTIITEKSERNTETVKGSPTNKKHATVTNIADDSILTNKKFSADNIIVDDIKDKLSIANPFNKKMDSSISLLSKKIGVISKDITPKANMDSQNSFNLKIDLGKSPTNAGSNRIEPGKKADTIFSKHNVFVESEKKKVDVSSSNSGFSDGEFKPYKFYNFQKELFDHSNNKTGKSKISKIKSSAGHTGDLTGKSMMGTMFMNEIKKIQKVKDNPFENKNDFYYQKCFYDPDEAEQDEFERNIKKMKKYEDPNLYKGIGFAHKEYVPTQKGKKELGLLLSKGMIGLPVSPTKDSQSKSVPGGIKKSNFLKVNVQGKSKNNSVMSKNANLKDPKQLKKTNIGISKLSNQKNNNQRNKTGISSKNSIGNDSPDKSFALMDPSNRDIGSKKGTNPQDPFNFSAAKELILQKSNIKAAIGLIKESVNQSDVAETNENYDAFEQFDKPKSTKDVPFPSIDYADARSADNELQKYIVDEDSREEDPEKSELETTNLVKIKEENENSKDETDQKKYKFRKESSDSNHKKQTYLMKIRKQKFNHQLLKHQNKTNFINPNEQIDYYRSYQHEPEELKIIQNKFRIPNHCKKPTYSINREKYTHNKEYQVKVEQPEISSEDEKIDMEDLQFKTVFPFKKSHGNAIKENVNVDKYMDTEGYKKKIAYDTTIGGVNTAKDTGKDQTKTKFNKGDFIKTDAFDIADNEYDKIGTSSPPKTRQIRDKVEINIEKNALKTLYNIKKNDLIIQGDEFHRRHKKHNP